MQRTIPLARKLSQRLSRTREIDVGKDIKVAVANADEVLVDFPKKIEHDEILVDFPQQFSDDDDDGVDDDYDEENDNNGGFLGFPKGGRKSAVVRTLDGPTMYESTSVPHPLALPETIDIPAGAFNGNVDSYNNRLSDWLEDEEDYDKSSSWLTYDEPEKSLLNINFQRQEGNDSHRYDNGVVENASEEPKVQFHQNHKIKIDAEPDEQSVEVDEARVEFKKPSNWIDDEESDSDEDSETYRQRILSQVAAKASEAPALDQEPSRHVHRVIPGRASMRRSSMPTNAGASRFAATDDTSPFSQGFDFAKQLPAPQPMERRRSLVNTTYEFEKGLEVQPRPIYQRRSSINIIDRSNDVNLLLGLRAFGAKDHDIRRILS